MPETKYSYYAALAEQTARQLTESVDNWTSFLSTAARLYKYSYSDQLMIHAQRPNATACADYDTWSSTMRRYIRRGAKGIALIDHTSAFPKLKYIYDVKDTGARENSRPLNLWQMEQNHIDAVLNMLNRNYGTTENNFEQIFEEISSTLADEFWVDHRRDIADIVAYSFPEEYNIDTVKVRFREAVTVSTTYVLAERCGIVYGMQFIPEDFQPIFDFNTPDTIAILGTAVSDISEQVLRDIELSIKSYERTKSHENEQPNLHENRGLRVPESDLAESAVEATRQVRTDAEGLFAESPPDSVESVDSLGEAVFALDGDRRSSESAVGADDGRADAVERRDRNDEVGESDGVGADDEQSESASRESDSERADLRLVENERFQGLQLSLFDLLPTEAEQIESIDKAESVPTPFAFFISDEDIEHILRLDGNVENARMRIATEFAKGKTNEEIGAFLSQTFKSGNGIITDNGKYSVWYAEDGIRIAKGDSAQYSSSAKVIPWNEAAERIGAMLDAGNYATNVELAEMRGLEVNTAAHHLWYMHKDMADSVKDEFYFPAVWDGGFDESTTRIENMLENESVHKLFISETAKLAERYAENREVMRFHRYSPDKILAELNELAIPRREFHTDITEIPLVGHFITDDEINEALSRGSIMEGGKMRIYAYFRETHTTTERANFLKAEYGEGGSTLQIKRSSISSRGKGIEIKKTDCPNAQMNWSSVAKRVDELVRKDRYLTDKDKLQFSQLEAQYSDVGGLPTPKPGYAFPKPEDLRRNLFVENNEMQDIAPTAIWEELAERGIVDGQVVDSEKLTNDPFMQEVINDVESEEKSDSNPTSVKVNDKSTAENATFDEWKADIRRNAKNFRITDDNLGVGGAKAKYQANINAIKLLKYLEELDSQALPEQQEVLSRYVGWGGLADVFDESKENWRNEYAELKSLLTPEEYAAARSSTLNAHYTSPTVIKAIYEAIGNMGFESGNILEPSMGVGNFFGLLPDAMQSSKLYGVELDSITGRIAKQLYPKADITVAGFETTDRRDFYDIAVGNVPFGNYKVNDKTYNKLGFTIHNYFFAKALDQVRPGGVVAFVTSRYTMDSESPTVRKYLAERADLLGAIRLPNNAFKANAGTEVVSDIIFLQKRDRPQVIEPDWVHLGLTTDNISVNSYFVEHPEMVLGTLKMDDMMYGDKNDVTCAPISGANLAEQLHKAI